jgi:starch phosphorylase
MLNLGKLDPRSLRVELYADAPDGGTPQRHPAVLMRALADSPGSHLYAADIPATRPAEHYTARVLPHREGVQVPLESPRILWQR